MSSVSRRAFGKFLRAIRTEAGKTLLTAGLHIETSKHTVARLEDGIPTKIVTAQIEQLLDLYAVSPEVRAEALQLWGEVREQAKTDRLLGNSKGYWQGYADQFESHFPHYLRLENTADRVSTHQLVIVPGLLQTTDYKRAIVRIDEPELSRVNLERRIEVIVRRQQRLNEADFFLTAWLSEATLRNQPGDATVMADQMRWLAEVGQRPNVCVRVIPFSAKPHRGLTIQSFTLLEFPVQERGFVEPSVVYLEGAHGALYHERADILTKYRDAITALEAVALSEEDTRDMVSRVAKEYSA
ncbi:helix-turn-helix domain-containing protein [Nocardia inohanensis]|uniref:helix-turn-helix domain-containing protein n=1 Tax=Nocardia inohanensis TaxID=209246 RepID=UPI0008371344|nr:helix-turn-helix transcriptional regulator [Nocardia inohanensis]